MMETAPPTARTRFFGLATTRAAPSPAALPGVNRSIAFIQPGGSGSCPSRGRSFHCLAPMRRNRMPSPSLSHSVQSSKPVVTGRARARTEQDDGGHDDGE